MVDNELLHAKNNCSVGTIAFGLHQYDPQETGDKTAANTGFPFHPAAGQCAEATASEKQLPAGASTLAGVFKRT